MTYTSRGDGASVNAMGASGDITTMFLIGFMDSFDAALAASAKGCGLVVTGHRALPPSFANAVSILP